VSRSALRDGDRVLADRIIWSAGKRRVGGMARPRA
jgi:hypothetical protein